MGVREVEEWSGGGAKQWASRTLLSTTEMLVSAVVLEVDGAVGIMEKELEMEIRDGD